MRPISKKRARLLQKRRELIERMKRNGPVLCAICGQRADDLHEVKSRARLGSLIDPENLLPLCRPCHRRVTEHPQWAAEQGWLKWSWE